MIIDLYIILYYIYFSYSNQLFSAKIMHPLVIRNSLVVFPTKYFKTPA